MSRTFQALSTAVNRYDSEMGRDASVELPIALGNIGGFVCSIARYWCSQKHSMDFFSHSFPPIAAAVPLSNHSNLLTAGRRSLPVSTFSHPYFVL